MNASVFANTLIDQLLLQGVKQFCIAPGSRSTPLALAVHKRTDCDLSVHFDERGLSFFALGISLAAQSPAAIIVTSGTAVGNLLPAVMEAFHSKIPLILLTADRPNELLDCGANQTTDQTKCFQNFVLWQSELPCPDINIPEQYIRSQAVQLVFYATKGGPAHLNCRFRDPLYSAEKSPVTQGLPQLLSFSPKPPTSEQLSHAKHWITRAKKGVIILGRNHPFFDPKPILALAKQLKWPVFADLLSQARRYPTSEQIHFFDLIIQKKASLYPDTVLWIGESLIFERSLKGLQNSSARFLRIDPKYNQIDPYHFGMDRIEADPILFSKALKGTTSTSSTSWLTELQALDQEIQKKIELQFKETNRLTETKWMHHLSKNLPPRTALYLGNSLPVRNASHFCFPDQCGPLFSNRGLSGIDGQVASAAGIATQLKAPLAVILGDLSCLHDLNSFSLLKMIKTPLTLFISNNFGGGIFSHLSIATLERSTFEQLFATKHSVTFEQAAKMFSIPYRNIDSLEELPSAFSSKGATIVEICTSREENACFQKQILEKCSIKSMIHS